MTFMQQVIDEMELWGKMTSNKMLGQMKKEIKECLQADNNMKTLIEQISQTETRYEAIKRIIQYVLYVLHCEIKLESTML